MWLTQSTKCEDFQNITCFSYIGTRTNTYTPCGCIDVLIVEVPTDMQKPSQNTLINRNNNIV